MNPDSNPVAPNLEQEQAARIFNSERQLPQTRLSNRYAGLNVLGLVADNSACGYYRVVNPLHLLKMHGANVEYGSHHSLESFLKYDIIIAPRQYSEEVYEILRFVMWDGKITVFEIDDDLDAVEPTSPAYYAYHPGSSELKWIHKVMSWCDGVTTTTREMARWCYKNNRNVGIIENFIDFGFRDWNVDVTYRNGYPTLTPQPLKRPAEWEDKTVIMWSGGTCALPDTEILTENGWKFFTDLLPNEKVCTLNPDNHEIEYHVPSEYINQYYEGDIHTAESPQINYAVTPNHWMYVSKQDNPSIKKLKFEKIQSQDLLGTSFYTKKDGIWKGESHQTITFPAVANHTTDLVMDYSDWLKVFGFWLGDGWTTKAPIEGQCKQVGFCQFKSDNLLKDVASIFDKYGVKYSRSKDDAQLVTTDRRLYDYLRSIGDASTKFIPKDILSLAPDLLRTLLDYYIMADGHKEYSKGSKNSRIRAWTASKNLADNLTELALKIGWAANVNTRPIRDGKIGDRILHANYPSYQINFIQNGVRNFLTPLVKASDQDVIVGYKGTVHCVTVKNHLIYVRRGGKPFWFGNTHELDLKLMGPQIKYLLDKYPQAHFAMYASPTQAQGFIEDYQIQEGRYTLIPARHFLDHPTGLDGADIGLCPLVCSQFNLAKSFLKPLEYFAKGIVPVTSNVGPYCRFNTRHPGYIVNTGIGKDCIGRTLTDGVEFLLNNPEELQRRKVEGRQLVIDKYSLEKNIDLWPQTWSTIQKAKMAGDVGPPLKLQSKSHYVTLGSAGPNDRCPCGSGLKYKVCCKNGFG